VRVAWFPQEYVDNPYLTQLRNSLQGLGVEFEGSAPWTFGRRWLWRNRGKVQLLHLHVVQRFYAYKATRARLRWVVRFARNLMLARVLGYRTVFTLHDLKPFDVLHPLWVDHMGHWVAVNLTDAVMVHYESGRRAVAERFGRRNGVFVCHHPSYIGLYPNEIPRDLARLRLGIAERHILFLFFGGIRPSKGIDGLIPAFRRLTGDEPRLLIVGRPWHPPEYLDALIKEARGDERIGVVAQFIPEEMVQLYLNAADAVVLPFKDVLTSGSTLLAMSFARPVVAPAKGCLIDEVPPGTGILYDPSDPDGLYMALQRCRSEDLRMMGEKAYEWASRFTFERLAQETLAAYRGDAACSAT